MLVLTSLLVALPAFPAPTPNSRPDASAQVAVCPAQDTHVLDALQEPDGSWSAAGFVQRAEGRVQPGSVPLGRAGDDLEVTCALLLDALGEGNTTRVGPRSAAVARGVAWVIARQDASTGRVGDGSAQPLAAFLLQELAVLDDQEAHRAAAERALTHLLSRQGPAGAWERAGQPDATSTGFACLALLARDGEEGRELRVGAVARAAAWLDARATGDAAAAAFGVLVGCMRPEVASEDSWKSVAEQRFAAAEALWNASLLRDPSVQAVLTLGAYQLGGATWKSWNERMVRDLVERQVNVGPLRGFWPTSGDPRGALWDAAWNDVALQAYYRYARLLSAR